MPISNGDSNKVSHMTRNELEALINTRLADAFEELALAYRAQARALIFKPQKKH